MCLTRGSKWEWGRYHTRHLLYQASSRFRSRRNLCWLHQKCLSPLHKEFHEPCQKVVNSFLVHGFVEHTLIVSSRYIKIRNRNKKKMLCYCCVKWSAKAWGSKFLPTFALPSSVTDKHFFHKRGHNFGQDFLVVSSTLFHNSVWKIIWSSSI